MITVRKLGTVGVVVGVVGTVVIVAACTSSASPRPATTTTPSTAPSSPALYVSTGATPGSLYAWPGFPRRTWYDNHDFIAGLSWTMTSPASASGVGTFHLDTCDPDCAAGSYKNYGIALMASQPESCAVHLYDISSGANRTKRAYVYVRLKARITSGDSPSFVPSFPPGCEPERGPDHFSSRRTGP